MLLKYVSFNGTRRNTLHTWYHLKECTSGVMGAVNFPEILGRICGGEVGLLAEGGDNYISLDKRGRSIVAGYARFYFISAAARLLPITVITWRRDYYARK